MPGMGFWRMAGRTLFPALPGGRPLVRGTRQPGRSRLVRAIASSLRVIVIWCMGEAIRPTDETGPVGDRREPPPRIPVRYPGPASVPSLFASSGMPERWKSSVSCPKVAVPTSASFDAVDAARGFFGVRCASSSTTRSGRSADETRRIGPGGVPDRVMIESDVSASPSGGRRVQRALSPSQMTRRAHNLSQCGLVALLGPWIETAGGSASASSSRPSTQRG